MTSIECRVCQLKYMVYDQNTYICKCGNLFGLVQCKNCGNTSYQDFDEMEVFNKSFRCNNCQFVGILSPCSNCSNINLRIQDQDPSICKNCNQITIYSKCEQCTIAYAIEVSKGTSIDGKLLRCPLGCGEMIAFKCTNCDLIAQSQPTENKMSHYCHSCKKLFYKQICDQCKQVTAIPEKQYSAKTKQKCTNKKCKQIGFLKDVKIQGLQVIEGKLIQPNKIDPKPVEKKQIAKQTSKFLQNEEVNLFDFDDNTPPPQRQQTVTQPQNINLLEDHADDQELGRSKVVICKICNSSTQCIITTPCNHKVSCYQCSINKSDCPECKQSISNRILNTFNRDFDQEIKERIQQERQK